MSDLITLLFAATALGALAIIAAAVRAALAEGALLLAEGAQCGRAVTVRPRAISRSADRRAPAMRPVPVPVPLVARPRRLPGAAGVQRACA